MGGDVPGGKKSPVAGPSLAGSGCKSGVIPACPVIPALSLF
ncbi:hypothetical protein X907_2393 [Glycocaulis alkaliphilus]|uniref:Uncharacterized protein n=1 Tax=Glycocaulis alkaliphilus TaxID=1434191 RepID=A0A3T0EC89_9PROT|nr:hypothetical protein X907_2393 [Glycocaulis alkaliphilus]